MPLYILPKPGCSIVCGGLLYIRVLHKCLRPHRGCDILGGIGEIWESIMKNPMIPKMRFTLAGYSWRHSNDTTVHSQHALRGNNNERRGCFSVHSLIWWRWCFSHTSTPDDQYQSPLWFSLFFSRSISLSVSLLFLSLSLSLSLLPSLSPFLFF